MSSAENTSAAVRGFRLRFADGRLGPVCATPGGCLLGLLAHENFKVESWVVTDPLGQLIATIEEVS